MVVRLILSVVVGLTLSLSPATYAMKQLELKSHSHIAAIDIPLSVKEKAWLAGQPTLTIGTWLPEMTLFGERDQLVLRPQDIVRQFATTEPGIGEKGADAAFNIDPAVRLRRARLG